MEGEYVPFCKDKREWEKRGVIFSGEGWDDWTNMQITITSLNDVDKFFGDPSLTNKMLGLDGGLTLLGTSNENACNNERHPGCYIPDGSNTIILVWPVLDGDLRTVIHELGHAVDYNLGLINGMGGFYSNSGKYLRATGWKNVDGGWENWSYPSGFVTAYAGTNPQEDFADTFAYLVDQKVHYSGATNLADIPSAEASSASGYRVGDQCYGTGCSSIQTPIKYIWQGPPSAKKQEAMCSAIFGKPSCP
jgi:hypothetical protein